MEVGFAAIRHVKVDNDVHALYVDASTHQVSRHQYTVLIVLEALETLNPLRLLKLSVCADAEHPLLLEYLGEHLRTLELVDEDDHLVVGEFLEDGLQRWDLLLLLKVDVVLYDSVQ